MEKKDTNKTRKNIVTVRLLDSEKDELNRKADAAGLPSAVWLRRRIAKGTIPNVSAMKERTAMLNRWNANLNMIAKWCNTHKGAADAIEVKAELVALHRLIRDELDTEL